MKPDAADAVSGAPQTDVDTTPASTRAAHRQARQQVRRQARRDRRRNRSPWRRAGHWALWGAVFLLIIGTGGTLALIGQQLNAPDWLRTQVENRIERNLAGAQIDFGGMEFVVNRGWRPRLRLWDVALSDRSGRPVINMSDAEISLAMRPLTRGQIMSKSILVRGVQANLRRDRDGSFALSFGETSMPVGQADSLPELIESWDRLLLLPHLSALTQVDIDSVSLRYADARQGRAWNLDGGSVQLIRDGDDLDLNAGFSVLSGRDFASSFEANYTSRIGETNAVFSVRVQDVPAQDIAAQSPALAWLGVVRAPISGAMRGAIGADGSLLPVSTTLQIGKGVVQPTDNARAIPFNSARTYFTYDHAEQALEFDEISVDSDWVSGVAEARAVLEGVEHGGVTDLVGQVRVSDLHIDPDGFFQAPLVPKSANADFHLSLNPFNLRIGQVSISDGTGHVLIGGAIGADEAGWNLALDAHMDDVTRDQILAFWPVVAAPKPRKWVSDNLMSGVFSDADIALRLKPGERPMIAADWTFENTDLRFLKTLPPIRGAEGQASFIGGRLVISTTKGAIIADQGGEIDIAGSSYIIPETRIKKAAPGILRAKGGGSVTAILSLLDRPPLKVMQKTPFPVDVAQGQAQIVGTLALPMKKKVEFDEIEFHLTGDVTGARSSKLVPGYTVVADNLDVTATQAEIAVSGPGRIDDLPANVLWRQPMGAAASGKGGQLSGTVELSQRLIDTFNIGLPGGTVSGRGQATFDLPLTPGQPLRLSASSDLRGVGLQIPPLGWRKPAKSGGKLTTNVTLGRAPRVDLIELETAGLSARGSVTTRSDGGLDRARFDNVRLAGWLRGDVELIGRGAGQLPQIDLRNGRVDLRNRPPAFSSPGGGGAAGTIPLKAALDELRISKTLALRGFYGNFQAGSAGLNGRFSGRLNGQTPVTGRLVPQSGGMAIEVDSKDGGGVFRSAGILNQAHGGDFRLRMVPDRKPDHYKGSLRVTNTRVKDAPTLAALMNAISVVGLVDEVVGQGILFTEVEAAFKLDPERLTVLSSSAIGPSMGVSLDGTYDLRTSRLGFRGVFSPIYLLNVIGSVLTRKGEGLIGFNFTLTGPSSDPRIQVNPLSGLTPGMFREIFRGQSAPNPNRTTPKAPSPAPKKKGLPGQSGGSYDR